jgi:hypothetical protein
MQIKLTRIEFISPCHFHGATVSSVKAVPGVAMQWDTDLGVFEINARGKSVFFEVEAPVAPAPKK